MQLKASDVARLAKLQAAKSRQADTRYDNHEEGRDKSDGIRPARPQRDRSARKRAEAIPAPEEAEFQRRVMVITVACTFL